MNVYDFVVKDIKGNDVSLSSYKGKLLLIVNTATHCGFTPTYKGLEKLYQEFNGKGFEILDFPCNQFGEQAPESNEEIDKIVKEKFGISFPRFAKIDVNGENASPLYTYLESQAPFTGFTAHALTPVLQSINKKKDPDYASKPTIKWNFTKFLVSKEGVVLKRYEPTVSLKEIEKELGSLLDVEVKEDKPAPEIKTLTLAMLTGCPHCLTAMRALDKAGISYEKINWSNKEGEEKIVALGIDKVPVLLIPSSKGVKMIHGEGDIIAWIKEGAKQ